MIKPAPPPATDLPDEAEIGALIRHVRNRRTLYGGTWQGRDAIFRFAAPQATEVQAREWQEACRIWPYMNGPRFRTAEPLAYLPEISLMVMERAPGTPLLDHACLLPGGECAASLAPATAWLRRYTDVSESWRQASPGGWVARAERAARAQPFAKLRRIESDILAALRRLSVQIEGVEWRVAVTHGDFHPNNLLIDGARLTGIDTGGSGRMPVLKDIARFLMHLARRDVLPSGEIWCGVDKGLRDAFIEAFALTETERRLVLPFFLGIEALIRVETPALRPWRINTGQRIYGALRDDLSRLAP